MSSFPRLWLAGLAVTATLTLSACNTVTTLPYTYSPASAMSATGAVEVGTFTYEPNKYLQSLPDDDKGRPHQYSNLSTSQQHSGGPPGESKPSKSTVKPNQARNTAMGSIYFERDVADIIRDATFTELRAIGITVAPNSSSRLLTGEVQNLLVDDLGYNVDWTLRIVYTVEEKANGTVVYSAVKEIKRRTAKFANALGALNDLIRLNIESLASDPQFLDAIRATPAAVKP